MHLVGSSPTDALWSATAASAFESQPLDTDMRVDVAVVGGGFTGLSAALHLAEAGVNVCLLEAQTIGFGASGRNTGEVVPGWSVHSPAQIDREFGPQQGAAMNHWVQHSARLVFELIDRHQIDCDATRTGWLMPASNPRRLQVAQTKHDQWAERGANVAMLDRASTVELTGSEHYIGAWLHRDGGTIQPLSYARGLANAAQRAGATMHEYSPVTNVEPSDEGCRVHTPSGIVHARQVIIATNAYNTTLFPELAGTVVPLRLFQTATTALGDNVARSILPQGQGISDSRRVLWAFRKDRFNRLVTGVTPLFVRTSQTDMQAMALHQLRTVYPQITAPQIEFFWNGLVAVTLDRLPRLIAVRDNIVAGLGYSGRGIAMATGMGRVLAERATGKDFADLPLPRSPLKAIPMQASLIPLARLRAWWWRQRDLWEDRF